MEQIFRKIFDLSLAANILVDESNHIKLANKSALTLFKSSEQELIGKNIASLIPDDVRSKHQNLVDLYRQTPLPRKMGEGRKLFAQRLDGCKFPVEIGLVPIKTDTGLQVLCNIIDLTKQYYAEEQFRLAVDSAPNGMLMINSEGVITLVNKQIEHLFDYSRTELMGARLELLIPDDFKAHHPKFVERFLANPQPRAMGIGRELYGKKKDGSLFPVEIGLQPLVEHDQSLSVLASIVDITKRRASEIELKEKSEELQEFAYRTSHDFKSPLTTMHAILQFIDDDLASQRLDEAQKNIQKIQQINQKMQTLAESILALTKSDLNSEPSSSFDFQEYLHRAKQSFAHQFASQHVTLEAHIQHRKDFRTEATKFEQILDNLISNGIKFANPNRDQRIVELCTYDDPEHFFLRVTDNGLGIPSENQGAVFDMFRRFHQDIEGHGIGLYTVKKFVHKLGGNLHLESSEQGTSIYLRFPHDTSVSGVGHKKPVSITRDRDGSRTS